MRWAWLLLVLMGCPSESDTSSKACADGYALYKDNCIPQEKPEPETTDHGLQLAEEWAEGLPEDIGGGDELEIVDCEVPLSGIPWDPIPPEARGGFERELEALDLSTLPERIEIAHFSAKERGLVAYALEIPPAELSDALDRDTVFEFGIMGKVVLGSIVVGAGDMDQSFFRRGMLRYYVCSRGFPRTLDGFKALFGWPTESYEVDSSVKCIPRLIARDEDLGIHIAVALEADYAWETEILLTNNRTDGQLDFVVYGPDDQLTDRSTFPAPEAMFEVTQPVPHQCMVCHSETWIENNVVTHDPSMGHTIIQPVVNNICF